MSKRAELDEFVDAFESVLYRDGVAEIEDFLPPPSHPLQLDVLVELIRIEIERRFETGDSPLVEEYLDRFVPLRDNPLCIEQLAFEEFRQRRRAGQSPDPSEYSRRLGIDASGWSVPSKSTSDLSSAHAHSTLSALRTSLTTTSDDLHAAAVAVRNVRKRRGETHDLGDWLGSFPPENHSFRFFSELHRISPEFVDDVADALAEPPRPGETFLDFEIVSELGKGAFGTVYLARQCDLAERPVVLKVAPDVLYESQMLARLQHANIVPIYSLHAKDRRKAVCMPYLGSVTLQRLISELRSRGPKPPVSGAELVDALDACAGGAVDFTEAGRSVEFREELKQCDYVGAVCRLFQRLADGLQHAHARAILHRDLKPANLLLTDEAQPMLLDFNLSEDSGLIDPAVSAMVGGTLPYMAPEVINAFQHGKTTADPRSDLYSLGVIFFETLTLTHPFPIRRGDVDAVALQMFEDRRQSKPDPRTVNPAISPDVASIVNRALSLTPGQRYQTAAEFGTDLARHLENRPLKFADNVSWIERASKWRRRHPRLSSAGGVAVIATALIAGLAGIVAVGADRLSHWEAREQFRQFQSDGEYARQFLYAPASADDLERGRQHCLNAIARFRIDPAKSPDDWKQQAPFAKLTPEQQDEALNELGELHFLLARCNLVSALYYSSTPSDRAAAATKAQAINDSLDRFFGRQFSGPRLQGELIGAILEGGGAADAKRRLVDVCIDEAASVRDALMIASTVMLIRDQQTARALLQRVVDQDPKHFWAWWLAGRCEQDLQHYDEAKNCFSSCIVLNPDFADAYLRRAKCWSMLGRFDKAAADYTRLIRRRPDNRSLYNFRADALMNDRRYAEALPDLEIVMQHSESALIAATRAAECCRQLGKHDISQTYIERAAKLTPANTYELLALADMWIQENELEAAVDVLDTEIPGRGSRQSLVLLEKKLSLFATMPDRTEEAIELAAELHKIDPGNPIHAANHAVMLARLGRCETAIQHAERLVASQPEDGSILYRAACIYAQCSQMRPECEEPAVDMLRRALSRGYGRQQFLDDPDLAPIRALPEFQKLAWAK